MTEPLDFLTDAVPAEPVVPNHRASKDPFDPIPGPSRGGNLFRRTQKAPEGATKPRTRKTASPPPPVVVGEFVEPLTDLYNTLAIALMPFKPQVSMAFISPAREANEGEKLAGKEPPTVAENCARAWDEVAQKNESVRRVLKTITTAGVWGGLFMAHAPILAAVMAETPVGENPAFGALFNPAKGAEDYLKEQAERE